MPSLATDPLRAMIKSVGRESIAGVLSFDEPITTQLPVESVRNLYLHVKQVDPTLPVYLVHAPIPEPPWNGQKDQMKVSQKYLALVSRYSQWADWVGFDIYPIPEAIAKVTSPLGGGTPVSDYRIAIADYLKWLAKNVTGKKHFLILQAFSYEDQGFPSWVARLYKARKPTMAELDQMVRISRENGAGAIGWWGQGLLDERDRKFWNQVLQTCEFASRKD